MRSYTLTLTNANQTYKIDDLIKGINSKERSMFAAISIQADSANANPVLIGGANTDANVYGRRLAANDIFSLGESEEFNYTSTLGLYAHGVTTAGMKLHIVLDER